MQHPDVVLVDVGGGIGTDQHVMKRLKECVDLARLVVVYERLSSSELGALWQLGVDTLLPCSHGLDALLVVLQRYVTTYRNHPVRTGVDEGLTEQEGKIISLLSAGHTANKIAQLLDISTSAVANAKRRIYRKLEVASQCQVVARATALGIISRPAVRAPATNGRPLGPMVAVLRGAAGPTRDRVAATLLAGGISVATEVDASHPRPTEGEGSESVFVVLVDPAPSDWPNGWDAGLPVALVRSTPPPRAEVLSALLRGALTVVTAERVGTDLVPALTLATHGYLTIEESAAGALLDAVRMPSGGSSPGLPELTSRECDILRSIANGHTVRLTARALGIAEKTVENTQARLFRKLGARNRPGALAAAHALGLLDLIPAARTPTPTPLP
ncbi:MAG TPA: LuxR C-terminal-related transcriptional regulator [Actinophytocola sp.]|uniref:LuxR C-terminal-related transcriptional regulator n=1 Tax=Actinophytocola sp. TaxID=1872138 RepID=UPI002DDD4279|nr:LuxR C-terminal-related transcriptional regulator [Actinophytocola sp.]HEV2784161.1 LuxR C-terminal-related transcriptional regulator [Actinophytocola sp.]